MRTSIKNLTVIVLALIAIAAWGLVVRQEIERRRLPEVIPPGSSIKLSAPKDTRPTEETPAIEIFGTITDAETGQPVVADVQAANVHIDDVTEFRLVFPASDEAITITVTAPGYQKWSVDIKPHIKRSKVITTPIKLKPQPDGDQAYDQTHRPRPRDLLGGPSRAVSSPARFARPIATMLCNQCGNNTSVERACPELVEGSPTTTMLRTSTSTERNRSEEDRKNPDSRTCTQTEDHPVTLSPCHLVSLSPLPLIGRPHSPGPGPVRQITVKARLASYEPASGTCHISVSDSRLQLGRLPVDNTAQIRILDAETGEVLERGLGEAEAAVYRDTDFAYGISFDPAVAPRRPCPNLMRHAEEWVNVNGISTIVNVLHYDPTRP